MNEIINIRGIECYEQNGTAYLKLETVAKGLGFTKKADSGNEVVNWTRVRGYLADLGVVQKCTTGDFIPENIFYRLAMKAKNETAEKFQALVADEIIPSIRKTGGYIPTNGVESDKEIMARAVLIAQKTIEMQNAQITEMNPKAEFYDAVTDSKTAITVGEVAKVLDCGMGRNKLFEFLRNKGILMQNNIPYQIYVDRGYFRIIESKSVKHDGGIVINLKTLVLQKGVDYIRKILKEADTE